MSPLHSEPRSADELICGKESVADIVYAEDREAEQALDRRLDVSPPAWLLLPELKRGFCPTCDDHEACSQGRPCDDELVLERSGYG